MVDWAGLALLEKLHQLATEHWKECVLPPEQGTGDVAWSVQVNPHFDADAAVHYPCA